VARRDSVGIRLLTRNGHDWSPHYPFIREAINWLKVRSCLIDGEAVACDENGLAVFERLRCKRAGRHVFLYAFDLLELNGTDLRREPIETRKATLASVLRGCLPGLRLNEHLACPSCCRRTASTAHFRVAASAEIRPTCPRRVAAARPSFQRRCAQPAARGKAAQGWLRSLLRHHHGALDVLGFSLFGWGIFPTRVWHWRRGGAGSIFTCPDITARR